MDVNRRPPALITGRVRQPVTQTTIPQAGEIGARFGVAEIGLLQAGIDASVAGRNFGTQGALGPFGAHHQKTRITPRPQPRAYFGDAWQGIAKLQVTPPHPTDVRVCLKTRHETVLAISF